MNQCFLKRRCPIASFPRMVCFSTFLERLIGRPGFSAFIFFDGLWCDELRGWFNVTIEHLLNSPIPRGFWESRICIDIPQNQASWESIVGITTPKSISLPQQSCGIIRSQLNMSPNSHFASFGCPTEIREVGSMEQKKITPRVLKGPKNPKIRIYGRNHLTVGFMIFMEKLTQKNSHEHSFCVEKNHGSKTSNSSWGDPPARAVIAWGLRGLRRVRTDDFVQRAGGKGGDPCFVRKRHIRVRWMMWR